MRRAMIAVGLICVLLVGWTAAEPPVDVEARKAENRRILDAIKSEIAKNRDPKGRIRIPTENERSRANGKAPWDAGLKPSQPQTDALPIRAESTKSDKSKVDATVTPQMEAVIAGNTEFAFDLYRRVLKENENLVFSPLTISAGFALLQPAARGETAKELNKTFRFIDLDKSRNPAFVVVLDQFRDPGQGRTDFFSDKVHKNTLQFASQIWVDENSDPFAPEYLNVVRNLYGLEPQRLSFENLEEARRIINAWVSKQTSQQIPELIPPNTLVHDPSLFVPTNAVWLDARWADVFAQSGDSSVGRFHAFDGDRRVTYMEQRESDSYADLNDLQVLQKNYLGARLSMLFLLPKKRDRKALERLEASLTAKRFQDLRRSVKPQNVDVKLPKFHLHSKLNLKESLKEMGLKRIWDQKTADLSGMEQNQQRSRYMHFSVHEGDIKVDEEGTKAAAGWAGGGGYGDDSPRPKPPPPPKFIADHPFLFLVQDNRTGSILFLGRVMKP